MRAPTAAWRKAPLLLLRLPALGSAVAAAALVLALATASAPLFLASAADAALALTLERTTPLAAGVTVETLGSGGAQQLRAADAAVVAATRRGARLSRPELFGLSQQLRVFDADGSGVGSVRLMLRRGALDHVDRRGPGGDGLWLPDRFARQAGLQPGDDIVLRFSEQTATTRVAGVYADLATAGPLPRFWRPYAPMILPPDPPRAPPAPLVLAELDSFVSVASALPAPTLYRWEAPLDPRELTLPRARAVGAAVVAIERDARDPATPLGEALDDLSAYGSVTVRTALLPLLREVDGTRAAMSGPVGLLSGAGTVVALVVLAAAAAFSAQRRRVEHQVLAAAGEQPAAAAARAVVEAMVPAALGTLAGVALAGALVEALGPSAAAVHGAGAAIAARVAAVAAAGLAVFGASTAVVGRRPPGRSGPGAGRRLASRLPWEPVLLAFAAASLYQGMSRPPGLPHAGDGARVDALALVFPLLFLAAGAGLVGRLQRRLLPRLRSASPRGGAARYLAARQLAAASEPSLLLVTASTLAVGVGMYAGVMAATTVETVAAKGQVLVGADAAIAIERRDAPTVRRRFATTVVQRTGAEIDGRRRVDVLGVDPATLASVVAWDRRFADEPLGDLLAALNAPSEQGRLPVLAVGAGVPDLPTLASSAFVVPLDVVARPAAFPGATALRPLLVVDTRRYLQAVETHARSSIDPRLMLDPFLWVRGEPEAVAAALAADRAGGDEAAAAVDESVLLGSDRPDLQTAAAVARRPALASAAWTFGYLQALGLASALLAVVGLLLYLQARQGEREVAYVLTRRMGLTRASSRAAVALEVAGMLAVALAAGTALALVAALLVKGQLDPLPQVPPTPLYTLPVALLAAVVAAVPLLAVAGAALVQRAADRARAGEVLRLAR